VSKSLKTLIATLMFAGTGTAFAASSIDMSVRGLITPSACTPGLGNRFRIGCFLSQNQNMGLQSGYRIGKRLWQLNAGKGGGRKHDSRCFSGGPGQPQQYPRHHSIKTLRQDDATNLG